MCFKPHSINTRFAEKQVTATSVPLPFTSVTFDGWYEDGTPVTSAAVYAFVPDHSTTLTAYFSTKTNITIQKYLGQGAEPHADIQFTIDRLHMSTQSISSFEDVDGRDIPIFRHTDSFGQIRVSLPDGAYLLTEDETSGGWTNGLGIDGQQFFVYDGSVSYSNDPVVPIEGNILIVRNIITPEPIPDPNPRPEVHHRPFWRSSACTAGSTPGSDYRHPGTSS